MLWLARQHAANATEAGRHDRSGDPSLGMCKRYDSLWKT